MRKRLSTILLTLAVLMPAALWAQGLAGDSTAVAAPTFRFEGDLLYIETETEGASIFYRMEELPNMDEATIDKISSNMIVTADGQQSIYYHQPIEITKSVIIKAIAVDAAVSEVSTLVYDYDAWQKLSEALDYGMDVSGRASDNSNVSDEMKEQLTHMLEEGKWVYYERMWDRNSVYNLTNEIMQLAHQIDEMMNTVNVSEAYVVLSGDGTGSTLTFYYDDQKENREGWMPMGQDGTNITWTNYAQGITKVIFDESFASCRPTSTAYWFSGFNNLVNIEGIENLKTDSVTNMSNMFYNCTSLTTLDVTGFNTQNVTNMYQMFCYCSGLTSIDLSSFNTENVTNMGGMFTACWNLTSLDVKGFNTQNVTEMTFMFQTCSGLSSLDVSHFNTAKVTETHGMFRHCSGLEILDLSNFNTEKVEEIRYMFEGCSSLKTIYVGESWSTANVKYGDEMFTGCTNLVGGAGTVYDADHVDYSYAHIDGGASNPGYFTDKNAPVELPNVEYSFDYNGVLWVDSDVTMAQVMEEASQKHNVAEHITAIVWHSSQPLTNSDLQVFDNPNMLIYVASDSLAPQNRNNVVVGDFAKNIVLKDVESGNGSFYCPQAFTAEMISYTHDYKQKTEVGVSRGWETIALPFDVHTIMHEKNGLIAPFGNSTSDKHFWLRQLTHQGLDQATAIQANWPYLISMPNSETYTSSYNLAGRVTFSAQNVVVPETEEYGMDMYNEAGGMLMMRATFSGVSKSAGVYALNVGEARGNNPEGSVFEVNYRDIRPFEAYTIHEGNGPAPQFIPVAGFTDGEATGIEDVRSLMSDDSGENWYDLNGRKLLQKPTRKGVYLNNGLKVIVR